MRTAMPKSEMKPTRLAIEMTGAVYVPTPNRARVFPTRLGDSVRKIARTPPMSANGRLISTSSDTRAEPIATLSNTNMTNTTTALNSAIVRLADCWASN